MSASDQILAVLREWVLDDEERLVTAERFRTDPSAWQVAVEEWGVSTLAMHAAPEDAHAHAERCLAALVAAGWADQANVEVCAHFDHDAGGWRGCINVQFGQLPPAHLGNGVPYSREIDRG